jgi:hypothetical protein
MGGQLGRPAVLCPCKLTLLNISKKPIRQAYLTHSHWRNMVFSLGLLSSGQAFFSYARLCAPLRRRRRSARTLPAGIKMYGL